MNSSIKKNTGTEARTTGSVRKESTHVLLIVSALILAIIAVISNFPFLTGNIPFINTLTGQKADSSNLQDRISVESKSITGAASTQGNQDTTSNSASSYTGGGTADTGKATNIISGDGGGSGNDATSPNPDSSSLPSSPNNADTGGVIPGNTIDDSSQPTTAADGNNGNGNSGAGDSTNNTNVGANNINNSPALSSGVYSSTGVRLDK
jgi:hypothetical protein